MGPLYFSAGYGKEVLNTILLIALAATVFSLFAGLVIFWKDGEKASEKSNKWMRWRIFFQGLTLLIFTAALLLHK